MDVVGNYLLMQDGVGRQEIAYVGTYIMVCVDVGQSGVGTDFALAILLPICFVG